MGPPTWWDAALWLPCPAPRGSASPRAARGAGGGEAGKGGPMVLGHSWKGPRGYTAAPRCTCWGRGQRLKASGHIPWI